MKKRNHFILAAVSSALVCTNGLLPVFAEEASLVQSQSESQEALSFYSAFSPLAADAGNVHTLLAGYQSYLSSPAALQQEIDALYYENTPYLNFSSQVYLSVSAAEQAVWEDSVRNELSAWIQSLQALDPLLPSISPAVLTEEPSEEPQEPGDQEDDSLQSPDTEENETMKPETDPDDAEKLDPEDTGQDSAGKETDSKEDAGTGQEVQESQDAKTEDTAKDGTAADKSAALENLAAAAGTEVSGAVQASALSLTYANIVFSTLDHGTDRTISVDNFGSYQLLPDFTNAQAWKESVSTYNTPSLWGQCTWFAWGRFYELYGFNPRFTGNGYQCASQLVSNYPDLFELSSTPKTGAVFSSDAAHNHVGIVLDYNETTGLMTIQEGNLDGVSNSSWTEAIEDYRTIEVTPAQLRAMYGDVVYANPKEGKVHTVNYTPVSTDLKTVVLTKLRNAFSLKKK